MTSSCNIDNSFALMFRFRMLNNRQLSLLSAPVLVTAAEAGSVEAQRLRGLLVPSAHLAPGRQADSEPSEPQPGGRKRQVFFDALN
jgi:hypothetical protein